MGTIVLRLMFKVLMVGLLLVACLGLALYWWSPVLASRAVADYLTRQGFTAVSVELGRPGWTGLDVPLLAFEHMVGGQQAQVRIERAHLTYRPERLRHGIVDRLLIPRATVTLTPVSATSVAAPATSVPSSVVSSLALLLQPIPTLPVGHMTIEQLLIRRKRESGAPQEWTVFGTVEQAESVTKAALTLQGLGERAYDLRLEGKGLGAMTAELRTPVQGHPPILSVCSEATAVNEQLQLRGAVRVDLRELAPLGGLLGAQELALRGMTGVVEAEWTGRAPIHAPIETLWENPALVVAAAMHADAALPEWKGIGHRLALKADATLIREGQQVEWAVAPGTMLRAEVPPSLLHIPEWLLAPNEVLPLEAVATSEVAGRLDLAAASTVVEARGPLHATYGSVDAGARAAVTGDEIIWRPEEGISLRGSARVEGRARPASRQMLHAADARWTLDGTLALTPASLDIILVQPSHLDLARVQVDSVTAKTGVISIHDPTHIAVDFGSGSWSVGPGAVASRLPGLKVSGTPVGSDQILVHLKQLSPQEQGWLAEGTARVTGLAPTIPKWTVPKSDWTVRLNAEPDQVRAEFDGLTTDKVVHLTGQLRHEFASKTGSGHFTVAPIQFNQAQASLSKLVTPWSYPADVVDGTASASAEVAWAPSTARAEGAPAVRAGKAMVVLDRLSGQLRGYPFAGLTTSASIGLEQGAQVIMAEPAVMSIVSLQTGVHLTNLSAQVQAGWTPSYDLAWVDLRRLSLSAFGGRVTSDGLRYEFVQPQQTTAVKLDGLQLQQILNLEQQKGLEGTGVLDGNLPITLASHGITVRDGVIEARSPGGVIRYRPSSESSQAIASSDSPMNLVLQPLSNFHYNVLQATAQYQEDGTLQLATRLEGRNPDWQKGRPVHFNLNVQENIPALMKSLGIVQGIQQSIEDTFDPSSRSAEREAK